VIVLAALSGFGSNCRSDRDVSDHRELGKVWYSRHASPAVGIRVSSSCRGAHCRMIWQGGTDASDSGSFKSNPNINVSVDCKKKGCLQILAHIPAMLILLRCSNIWRAEDYVEVNVVHYECPHIEHQVLLVFNVCGPL
jgi:hypothetical protein